MPAPSPYLAHQFIDGFYFQIQKKRILRPSPPPPQSIPSGDLKPQRKAPPSYRLAVTDTVTPKMSLRAQRGNLKPHLRTKN
jgi:hypothetical protein